MPVSVMCTIAYFAIVSAVGIGLVVNAPYGQVSGGPAVAAGLSQFLLCLAFLVFVRRAWVRIYALVLLFTLATLSTFAGFRVGSVAPVVILSLAVSGWWLAVSLAFGRTAHTYFTAPEEDDSSQQTGGGDSEKAMECSNTANMTTQRTISLGWRIVIYLLFWVAVQIASVIYEHREDPWDGICKEDVLIAILMIPVYILLLPLGLFHPPQSEMGTPYLCLYYVPGPIVFLVYSFLILRQRRLIRFIMCAILLAILMAVSLHGCVPMKKWGG